MSESRRSNSKKRRRRGITPHGAGIVELREKHRWTRAKLAEIAGVNEKTVIRAERGVSLDPDFLGFIATALGVKLRDIARPDFLRGDKPEFWLNELEQADRMGDYATAARIGEEMVEHLLSGANPLYVSACVRLAIVHDHQHGWEKALALLDRVLGRSDSTPAEVDYAWARYQRGVIQRVFAEDLRARTGRRDTKPVKALLKNAERDFCDVSQRGGDDLKLAADHQLGVLNLLRGRYDQALKTFQSCLQRRQRAADTGASETASRFRQAYEHRRMGQCYAFRANESGNKPQQDRDRRLAEQHFRQAKQLADVTKHARLQLDVARDLCAWGFEEPDLHHTYAEPESE